MDILVGDGCAIVFALCISEGCEDNEIEVIFLTLFLYSVPPSFNNTNIPIFNIN